MYNGSHDLGRNYLLNYSILNIGQQIYWKVSDFLSWQIHVYMSGRNDFFLIDLFTFVTIHINTQKYLQKNSNNVKKELRTKEFRNCHSMQKNCHKISFLTKGSNLFRTILRWNVTESKMCFTFFQRLTWNIQHIYFFDF